MRILVVEDDHRVARGMVAALTRAGHDVLRVATVAQALEAPAADIVLLDLGLPDGDGLTVCRHLRRLSSAGVIMVTARGGEADRVRGLRGGADDYVVKPFGVAELLARVEAVARRTRRARTEGDALGHRQVGDLELDLDARRARVATAELDLTPKEFELLEYLSATPGRVRSRSQIVERVWQSSYEAPSRTLDVHIASLRAKLAGSGCALTISTIRGVGYRLCLPEPPGGAGC